MPCSLLGTKALCQFNFVSVIDLILWMGSPASFHFLTLMPISNVV